MFGCNPKRPPVKGDGSVLDVQDIFPTFQGEGPYAGRASVFVRLGGCNLACTFCDTEFESYQPVTLDAIMQQVRAYANALYHPLIVISGGEPLRQPIEHLCDALLNAGYDVQIETNGTLYRFIDARVSVVCSPKAGDTGYHPLRPDTLARVDALKFIISATNASYQHVPDVGQSSRPDLPVYVQPMDEYNDTKNAQNLAYTMRLARQQGYMVSLQLHKMLEVA